MGHCSSVISFDAGDGSRLYAGGGFNFYPGVGSYTPHALLRWDGQAWEVLQGGPTINYGGFRVLDEGGGPKLYGSWIEDSGVYHIARWTGTRWETPTSGAFPDAAVSVAEAGGPVIYGRYAAGSGVKRWTGTSWTLLGVQQQGNGIKFFIPFKDGPHEHLYVAGDFTGMNGVTAWGIARLNGNTWEPLDNGSLWLGVDAWCVGDIGQGQELFLGGVVSPAGGPFPFPGGIVAWNGQRWRTIPYSVGGAAQTPIFMSAMAVFDDGTGPSLYVAGSFSSIGGVSVRNIGKWNGQVWMPVVAGIGGIVEHFAVFNDPRGPSLFAGGSFVTVGNANGGAQSPALAQLVGCPGPAYVDCDLRGGRNANDFMCFINKYAARDPYADCDGNGFLNAGDFMCFMQRFGQ